MKFSWMNTEDWKDLHLRTQFALMDLEESYGHKDYKYFSSREIAKHMNSSYFKSSNDTEYCGTLNSYNVKGLLLPFVELGIVKCRMNINPGIITADFKVMDNPLRFYMWELLKDRSDILEPGEKESLSIEERIKTEKIVSQLPLKNHYYTNHQSFLEKIKEINEENEGMVLFKNYYNYGNYEPRSNDSIDFHL